MDEEFLFCRICFAIDTKLYSLDTTTNDSFGNVYLQLAQIPIFPRNQHVCFECASLLHKYHEFKSKCLKANNMLSSIEAKSIKVNEYFLQRKRERFKLGAGLSFSPVLVVDNIAVRHNDIDEDDNDDIAEAEHLLNSESEESEEVKVENNSVNETQDLDEDIDYLEEYVNEVEWTQKNKIHTMVEDTNENDTQDSDESFNHLNKPSDIEENVTDIESTDEKIKISLKKRRKNTKEVDLDFFKDHTIIPLTREAAIKEILLRKESQNYKYSLYKCNLCYRGYGAKRTFENHMKKHSPKQGNYECDICHLRFRSKRNTEAHLHRHKFKFICKHCPYVCFGMGQARHHVNTHNGRTYACDICGKQFRLQHSIYMHKYKNHPNEMKFENVCQHCGSVFGTPFGLLVHTNKLHSHETNAKLGPECKECGVHFASKDAWKRHLVQSSKHIVRNGCDICGDRFPSMEELKTHKRVHSQYLLRSNELLAAFKRAHTCPICNEYIHTKSEYKSHIRQEHPEIQYGCTKPRPATDVKNHICEICGDAFRLESSLIDHRNKHTGARPYSCDQCDKAYRHQNGLYIHKRYAHSGDQRVTCELCGRVCAHQNAFNKHLKLHLGVRPHKCELCDKTFLYASELKPHIKHTHNKVPWPNNKRKK